MKKKIITIGQILALIFTLQAHAETGSKKAKDPKTENIPQIEIKKPASKSEKIPAINIPSQNKSLGSGPNFFSNKNDKKAKESGVPQITSAQIRPSQSANLFDNNYLIDPTLPLIGANPIIPNGFNPNINFIEYDCSQVTPMHGFQFYEDDSGNVYENLGVCFSSPEFNQEIVVRNRLNTTVTVAGKIFGNQIRSVNIYVYNSRSDEPILEEQLQLDEGNNSLYDFSFDLLIRRPGRYQVVLLVNATVEPSSVAHGVRYDCDAPLVNPELEQCPTVDFDYSHYFSWIYTPDFSLSFNHQGQNANEQNSTLISANEAICIEYSETNRGTMGENHQVSLEFRNEAGAFEAYLGELERCDPDPENGRYGVRVFVPHGEQHLALRVTNAVASVRHFLHLYNDNKGPNIKLVTDQFRFADLGGDCFFKHFIVDQNGVDESMVLYLSLQDSRKNTVFAEPTYNLSTLNNGHEGDACELQAGEFDLEGNQIYRCTFAVNEKGTNNFSVKVADQDFEQNVSEYSKSCALVERVKPAFTFNRACNNGAGCHQVNPNFYSQSGVMAALNIDDIKNIIQDFVNTRDFRERGFKDLLASPYPTSPLMPLRNGITSLDIDLEDDFANVRSQDPFLQEYNLGEIGFNLDVVEANDQHDGAVNVSLNVSNLRGKLSLTTFYVNLMTLRHSGNSWPTIDNCGYPVPELVDNLRNFYGTHSIHLPGNPERRGIDNVCELEWDPASEYSRNFCEALGEELPETPVAKEEKNADCFSRSLKRQHTRLVMNMPQLSIGFQIQLHKDPNSAIPFRVEVPWNTVRVDVRNLDGSLNNSFLRADRRVPGWNIIDDPEFNITGINIRESFISNIKTLLAVTLPYQLNQLISGTTDQTTSFDLLGSTTHFQFGLNFNSVVAEFFNNPADDSYLLGIEAPLKILARDRDLNSYLVRAKNRKRTNPDLYPNNVSYLDENFNPVPVASMGSFILDNPAQDRIPNMIQRHPRANIHAALAQDLINHALFGLQSAGLLDIYLSQNVADAHGITLPDIVKPIVSNYLGSGLVNSKGVALADDAALALRFSATKALPLTFRFIPFEELPENSEFRDEAELDASLREADYIEIGLGEYFLNISNVDERLAKFNLHAKVYARLSIIESRLAPSGQSVTVTTEEGEERQCQAIIQDFEKEPYVIMIDLDASGSRFKVASVPGTNKIGNRSDVNLAKPLQDLLQLAMGTKTPGCVDDTLSFDGGLSPIEIPINFSIYDRLNPEWAAEETGVLLPSLFADFSDTLDSLGISRLALEDVRLELSHERKQLAISARLIAEILGIR